MTTARQMEMLAQIPLLQGVSRRNLREHAALLRQEIFEAGENIVVEGEVSGRCFLLLEGQARVVVGGRTRRLVSPGALIGELSVFDRSPHSATVVAETPVVAASLTGPRLLAALQANWPMTRAVLATLARRIRLNERSLLA